MLDLMDRLRTIVRRHRDLQELKALSARDLADLGLSRDEAILLATLPDDVPGRVAAMARVFGVDEDTLHRERNTWNDLLETCAECKALPTCARFMAHPGDARQAAAFCPNAGSFAEAAAQA